MTRIIIMTRTAMTHSTNRPMIRLLHGFKQRRVAALKVGRHLLLHILFVHSLELDLLVLQLNVGRRACVLELHLEAVLLRLQLLA